MNGHDNAPTETRESDIDTVKASNVDPARRVMAYLPKSKIMAENHQNALVLLRNFVEEHNVAMPEVQMAIQTNLVLSGELSRGDLAEILSAFARGEEELDDDDVSNLFNQIREYADDNSSITTDSGIFFSSRGR